MIKIMTSADMGISPQSLSHARAYAHATVNNPAKIRRTTQSSIFILWTFGISLS